MRMRKSSQARSKYLRYQKHNGQINTDRGSQNTLIVYRWVMSGTSTTKHITIMTILHQKSYKATNSIFSTLTLLTSRKRRLTVLREKVDVNVVNHSLPLERMTPASYDSWP